jgi:hypothetical protein
VWFQVGLTNRRVLPVPDSFREDPDAQLAPVSFGDVRASPCQRLLVGQATRLNTAILLSLS